MHWQINRDRLQSLITGLEERVLSDNIQAREYWAIKQVKHSRKRGGHLCEKLFYFELEFEVNWPEQEIELEFDLEWKDEEFAEL